MMAANSFKLKLLRGPGLVQKMGQQWIMMGRLMLTAAEDPV
jgi:hypothetical protein